MQTAIDADTCFVWPQLRIYEEENKRERQNCVHPRPPELPWIAGCQVGKEDPAERRGQCHISLKAKLPSISQKTIFEENKSKDPPTHSNTQRLQLVPHEQQHQCRRRPRVDVLKLTSAPVLRHAYDSGQRVEDNRDYG